MPPKESADLLIEARWVLPIGPVNSALQGHAVAVRAGRILAIGPAAQMRSRFEARDHVVRCSHALLPGFINAHTCAAMVLLRGFPGRRPQLSPDFVRDGARLAMAEMLSAGITAFGDSYLFPEETAAVVSEHRMRAAIGLPVAEASTAWAENATAHLAKAERLWDEYKDNPWVSLQFAPHAANAVNDSTLIRVRRVADELDARVVMSVHATESEVRDSLAQHGRRPLHRLDELGLLRPGFTAVHMNCVDEADLAIIARTGISVVACPQATLRHGNSCPIKELTAHASSLGLGTESAVTVGALDMLAETRIAALLAPSSTALGMLKHATLDSAATLGLAGEVGSLEPGKAADMLCVDLQALACQPDISAAESIIFSTTRQQISDVWIAGRPAMQERRLLAFDEQELAQLRGAWTERIQGALT